MTYTISRYPVHLIDTWMPLPGRSVMIRPVLPQDEEQIQSLVRALSPQSRYNRFLSGVNELTAGVLRQLTQVDYSCHLALLAETFEGSTEVPIGEARYVVDARGQSAEFALAVADAWHGFGVATRLLSRLTQSAQAAGLDSLQGEVLVSNTPMLRLARKAGFALLPHEESRLVRITKRLEPSGGPAAPWCAAHALPGRLPAAAPGFA